MDEHTQFSYGGYYSSCKGKKRYYSYSEAHAVAKFVRKKYGPRVSAYECRHCRMWHVGHNRPRLRKLSEEHKGRLQ